MRSSPSKPDLLDPGRRGFAHRGLHGTDAPENTLAAFRGALDFGAGIECDLRLTTDGQPVVFHDADARRLCGSPLKIGQSRWPDLVGLRVGTEPIPSLEQLLDLVDGRVPLLLEVKVNRDVRRWAAALKRALSGYRGPFAVMSFDARIPRQLKTNMPEARRGLVIRDSLPLARRRLAMWLADPHFIAVERTCLSRPWVARLRQRMPVYSWTIRTAAERAQAEVQADALIWEGDGRPRN